MIDYQKDMPPRMHGLPLDDAGRPVPYFVEYVDGKPDFRVMSAHHMKRAITERLCWVCGQSMFKFATFTAGPMCLVNLNSAEPPSHHECAVYSALHCPFLTNPAKVRREAHLPEAKVDPAGISILRNPGVTCLIVTDRWLPYRDGMGILFSIGRRRWADEPRIERVEWYAEGRPATTPGMAALRAAGPTQAP
jgi:hypothetical protein